MEMGFNLRYSIATLLFELATVAGLGEYVIFGSTALRARNIITRTPDDIDVIVTRRVWGALLGRGEWRVETPNAGDPPILTLDTPHPLHLFFDWRDDAVYIDPMYLLVTAEHALDLRVATVEEVLRHKRAAYACIETNPSVAKHLPDIEACVAWLEARS